MSFFKKNREVFLFSAVFLGVGVLAYLLHSFKKENRANKSIVIGDSVSILISKNNAKAKILGSEQSEKNLWKSGMNLNWLKNAVAKFPFSNDIGNVVISIGANGGYNKNEDISGLFDALQKTFPNAQFYAVKGSWGWGNIKDVTEARVNEYYDKFKEQGAIIIKTPIGKTKNPHVDLAVYKTIGQEINNTIK
jgi:flavodoxin